MKKKKILLAIITCLTMSLFAMPALAAESAFETDANIAVSVEGGGTVTIEPLEGAPEPLNGKTLTVKDGETQAFAFHFTEPCDVKYKITQIKGNEENVIYDDSEYMACIFVESTSEGLKPVYVFGTSNEKTEAITFENTTKPAAKTSSEQGTSKQIVNPKGVRGVKTGDVATPLFYVGSIIALLTVIACVAAKRRQRQDFE